MNKRMLNKVRKLSINANRLNDNREQYPVEWLLKDTSGSGYFTNLDRIKCAILCMDKGYYDNYQHLSDEDKIKVEKLIANDDVVDMVLLIVFQWFGTMVGRNDIGNLMDEIRKLKYEEQDLKGKNYDKI